MNDPISDMLTRIRNAHRALLPAVEVPHSKLKESIAHILKKEGYVAEVAIEGTPLKKIKLKLKYEGRKGVIEGLRRVSSPGLRRYVGATEIPRVRGGLGVAVVSASGGLMTDVQARQKKICGGIVFFFLWKKKPAPPFNFFFFPKRTTTNLVSPQGEG